jgi:hypothetical protein
MNHYYKIALACFTALFVSTPVMAKGGESCGGANATPSETRNCLARMNDPARVRDRHEQEKRDRCEQNAKNRKLQGGAKAAYISSCMSEDEAAAAHASATKHGPATAPRTSHGKKAAAAPKSKRRTANSCVAQANKGHLKGKKRREFLKTCKPH